MNIANIINYEGDNSIFIWKHPIEDFNTGTQLIVHESQEAIFFKNGQALDLFGPGKYTLETENIPFLNRMMNRATNDKTPFHAEIYYINLTEQRGIKWGTDSKVMFVDPCNNNYAFPIGARGEMSLRVSDSRKLLLKLVGTEKELSQSKMYDYFRAPIMMHIKSYLPKVLREKQVSIYELDTNIYEFSLELQKKLSGELENYGVKLENFWITEIVKPEDDPVYIQLRNLRGRQSVLMPEGQLRQQEALINQQIEMINKTTDVEKQRLQEQLRIDVERKEIDNKAYEQQKLGYSFQQARQYDVMEQLAANEGTGSDLRNATMGLGMGIGMGGPIGNAFGVLAASTLSPDNVNPYATNIGAMHQSEEKEAGMVAPPILHIQEEEENIPKVDNIMSKYCINCGYELNVDAKFCPMCGTKRGE